MSLQSSIAACSAYLIFAGAALYAQSDRVASAKVDTLTKAIIAGDVEKIDILRLPKYYESVVAIRPVDLENRWFYRMTLRELRPAQEKPIAEALVTGKVQKSDREGDLRWGIVFYSKSDQRLGVIYFDETGRYGSIDQTPVSFAPGFFTRLKNALHLSIE